ncbi:MAG: glycosyltransferase family 4 protein [Methylococcus sp.]|nr:glycosyltransferase family 4 protein [Methylococcus sp.]
MSETVRLAYLISRYPAISHTFILREVLGLRQLGFDICIASVNPPDRPLEQLTATERTEAEAAWFIKPSGVTGAALALIQAAFHRPRRLASGLWFALSLGGFDGKKLLYQFAYWVEAVMVGQWMQREHLHHLHVHFATPASMVGLIAKHMFPIGFSFTVHGYDEFYASAYYRLKEKVAGADFVVCISHFARSQVMLMTPYEDWRKLDICRLGVDPTSFALRPEKTPGDVFELLCVGRLVAAKGQHTLLDALAIVLAKGRKVRLTLVGGGPDRDSLEAHVAKKNLGDAVCFTGAINQDDIQAYYARADAFVLPSFAEGLPVVLMEAMALGIPCISTYITGVPELIQNGVQGLLVTPSDTEGLAAAIERLMDDPELCRRLVKAGRAKVLADYELNGSIARLAQVFTRRLSAD